MSKPLPFSPAMYPIFLAEKSPFNPPKPGGLRTRATDDGVCLALSFGIAVPGSICILGCISGGQA
jgi:hypothetical protein